MVIFIVKHLSQINKLFLQYATYLFPPKYYDHYNCYQLCGKFEQKKIVKKRFLL